MPQCSTGLSVTGPVTWSGLSYGDASPPLGPSLTVHSLLADSGSGVLLSRDLERVLYKFQLIDNCSTLHNTAHPPAACCYQLIFIWLLQWKFYDCNFIVEEIQ